MWMALSVVFGLLAQVAAMQEGTVCSSAGAQAGGICSNSLLQVATRSAQRHSGAVEEEDDAESKKRDEEGAEVTWHPATIQDPSGIEDFTGISGFLFAQGQKVWRDRDLYTYSHIDSTLQGAIVHVGLHETEPLGARTISCVQWCEVIVSYEFTHSRRDGGLPVQLSANGFTNLGDDMVMISPHWAPGFRTWKKELSAGTSVTLTFTATFTGLIAVKDEGPLSFQVISGYQFMEGQKVWSDRDPYTYSYITPNLQGAIAHIGLHEAEPMGARRISCPQRCAVIVSYEFTHSQRDGGLIPQLLAKHFTIMGDRLVMISPHWAPGLRTWKKELSAGASVTLSFQSTFVGVIAVKLRD